MSKVIILSLIAVYCVAAIYAIVVFARFQRLIKLLRKEDHELRKIIASKFSGKIAPLISDCQRSYFSTHENYVKALALNRSFKRIFYFAFISGFIAWLVSIFTKI